MLFFQTRFRIEEEGFLGCCVVRLGTATRRFGAVRRFETFGSNYPTTQRKHVVLVSQQPASNHSFPVVKNIFLINSSTSFVYYLLHSLITILLNNGCVQV